MSLTYLSGDDAEIGKSKKRGGGGSSRSQKRAAKKAAPGQKKKLFSKKLKKTKEEKKAGRKRVFKKVAKVAVAPARIAFLTVVSLNGVKLASKLARVWNKPNGKETLKKFWDSFGGDFNKLKAAIIKGSKQQISGEDQVGAVALTTAIATATPIMVALVPIIKQFKAAGSPEEASDFNDSVEQGKKDLADNEDVPKDKVSMPKNKDAGIVVDKSGEATEDERENKKNRSEKETGGTESDDGDGGDEKKKLSKSGAGGGTAEGGGSSEEEEAKNKMKMASLVSPIGIFGKSMLFSMMFANQENLFVQLVNTICLIGLLLIPFAVTKNPIQKFAYKVTYAPFNAAMNFINSIKTQWQTKTISR